MENTIFGFLLFIFVYSFLLWVTDYGNLGADSSSGILGESTNSGDLGIDSDRLGSPSDDDFIVPKSADQIAALLAHKKSLSEDKPIEQQFKDILWEDEITEQGESAVFAEQDYAITEDEVSKLTLRQARKVAKRLDIRQKVNGKDASKDWLIRQIKAKVRASALEVRAAYDEVVKTKAA